MLCRVSFEFSYGLEFARRVGLEGPLPGEAVHVLRRDLRERTVALIRVVTGG